MGGDIQDWFKSLPLFTRYWFGGTILFTLLGRFGLLQPAWLVLYLEPLIHRFQVKNIKEGSGLLLDLILNDTNTE